MATLVQQDIVLAELPREAGPLIEVFQVVAVYLVLLPSGSTAVTCAAAADYQRELGLGSRHNSISGVDIVT